MLDKSKKKIAIVRGKFLNKYEMQFFEPLVTDFDITAFGSLTSFHHKFRFPCVQLPCPLDVPEFPFKWQLINRLFVDGHYLWGLEKKLSGFDLVHTAETYYHYTQQCLNAKRDGKIKKVIATVLENIPFNNEGIWGRKMFKARARKELDHIIALTNKTRDVLIKEGADPKKITVIHHHIDTSKFLPNIKNWKNVYKKNLTILFTGRLEEYKGVFDILTAANFLISDADLAKFKLKFLFVGSGGEINKMKSMAKDLGIEKNVFFSHVSYDEMPNIYLEGDIFVAPSKPTPTFEEQYCTALLEAQSCGLPIVTTASGGIPENVGDAAILIAPGDTKHLTESIKKFILDPQLRSKYGQVARKRAETVHDMKIGAKAMKELYLKVLAKN